MSFCSLSQRQGLKLDSAGPWALHFKCVLDGQGQSALVGDRNQQECGPVLGANTVSWWVF